MVKMLLSIFMISAGLDCEAIFVNPTISVKSTVTALWCSAREATRFPDNPWTSSDERRPSSLWLLPSSLSGHNADLGGEPRAARALRFSSTKKSMMCSGIMD